MRRDSDRTVRFFASVVVTSCVVLFHVASWLPESAPVASAAASGLQAAYGFDEGTGGFAADASGNGNGATLSDATWTSGKFGTAVSLNGTSQFATVASSPTLNLTTGTLEAWVKFTSINRWNGIIAKGNVNQDAKLNYAIELDDTNVVTCEVGNGSTFNIVKSTSTVATGQFYHLACTWDGARLRLYINGALNRSTNQTITPASNTAPLSIGQYGGNVDRFSGVIDEVRIYNVALSQALIQTDMNSPVGRAADTTAPVRSAGSPSGTLPAGTRQTTLTLITNEAATCRYGTTANVAYSALPNAFATTGGTSHSTAITGLSDGSSYTYYVRCSDQASNANLDDFAITFSVAQPADTTPPVRSGGSPSGTLAAGTTQTTLSLATNEAATCRYGTVANVAYSALPNTFATTGGTAHSTTVAGLTNGSSYAYYIRCSDQASNPNPDDFTIAFGVAQAPSTLRAAYALNEASGTAAADASGNGNTGAVTSGTWTTSAKFGGALSFNGTSSVVTVGSRASLDLSASGTLEAWVRLNALNRWNGVLAKGNVNIDASHNYAIEVDTNNLVNCEVGNGTSFNVVKSAASLTTGQFYHVACTWDGSQLRLYINGVLSRSTSQTLTPAANTAPLYLGQYGGDVDRFAGTLDEVRIYGSALTQAQIQTDMATPLGTSASDTSPPVRSNGQPAGVLPAGTTQATLALTTNENATCRYGTAAGTSYALLPTPFSATGSTSHSSQITGLTNGGSFTYYVRCVDVAGNSNPDDFTIAFSVAQPVPDFTVSASPSSRSIIQGSAASYGISVTAVNGFAGTVALQASGLPSGAQATLTPATVSGSGSATLDVSTSPTTPTGTVSIIITATSGSLAHTTNVSLTVAAQTYALSGTVSPTSFGAGTTITVSGTATASANADAAGNFVVTGLPNGSYTVTAAKSGYTFTPVSQARSINGADVTDVDFTAAQAPISVAITAPTAGATVANTFSISATASGGVAGVQFKVDGANVGAEDTSSPYSVQVTAPAGTHTLVAVARDESGGTVSSDPIAVTVRSGSGTKVTIDGAEHFQTMDGLGVNINALSWKNGELQPALDLLIDQLGTSMWRVCFDMEDWEGTNDDASPSTQDWAFYNAIYSSAKFQNLWGTLHYLNSRGIHTNVAVSFMGRVPSWMGGSTINADSEDEWVEMMSTFVQYARNTEHVDFDLFDPINEPDWDGIEGPQVRATQYTRLLHKLSVALDGAGISDLRFLGPNTAFVSSGVSTYMPEMMSDPVVMSRVDHFGLHNYDGTAGGADGAIKNSAYPTRNFWMTEFTSPDDIMSFLSQNPAGLMVWEAYDSVFNHAILAGRGSTPPNDDTAGPALLAYNSNTGVYTPRVGFYQVAQAFKYVQPGAIRVGASESNSNLTIYAFLDPATQRVTIVGRNTGGSSLSLSGTLSNVPGVAAMQLYQTYGGGNFVQGADVVVSGGSFFVTVQANSFFTLTGIVQ